jgi:hypothetical protein
MWHEEDYDVVGAFEEHDLDCESDDDFSDLELDSDLSDESEAAEGAEAEDFDEED